MNYYYKEQEAVNFISQVMKGCKQNRVERRDIGQEIISEGLDEQGQQVRFELIMFLCFTRGKSSLLDLKGARLCLFTVRSTPLPFHLLHLRTFH